MIAGTGPMRPASEGLLHGVWVRREYEERRIRTVNGAEVQVVFPGRLNGAEGPDFLDASVHVEGRGLMRGDVEVHVRARDWISHGHHRDPFYNRVVLHVVWDADSLWTERQDGEHIETVSLKGCVALNGEGTDWKAGPLSPADCCDRVRALGPEGLGRVLDGVGDERLAAKSARFEGELDGLAPEEVLFRGLMRALGYSRNREPFLELARLLPWSAIEALAYPLPDEERSGAITAWLLGVAGLLEAAPASARELWHWLPLRREMDGSWWRLAGVRPANHPARRILGAGEVLARFAGEGLMEGFKRATLLAAHHRDPGLLLELLVAPPFIGRERAREMVVNVALPFFHALGGRSEELSRAALQLFALAPAGQGNRKVKDMAMQLGIGRTLKVPLTARREQGLIHLIEGPCRYGWCGGCPVGRAVPYSKTLAAVS